MTAPQRFRQYFRVLFAASAMLFATATAGAAVCYVTREGGAVTKDGESWTTAYDEAAFPAAILSAGAGDEIWVKAGVYRPSTNDATKSFVLKDGVAVYGGFAGTETSSADRSPTANVTVLTGDLANDDEGKINGVTVSADQIQGTNSACVVTTNPGCGPTTVLDGFTITAGKNTDNGGGMDITESDLIVTNCAFSGNSAPNGGGIATSESDPVIEDCRFSGNKAGSHGGGMFDKGGSSTLRRCTFSGNTANRGGGMALTDGSLTALSDCTFTGNAAVEGGGMYNGGSAPTVANCAFEGNASNASESGGGGMCNKNSSPAVTNCTFSGNTAVLFGGAMYNYQSAPTVTDCAFSGNRAKNYGGGMCNDHNSAASVANCTFSGNAVNNGGGGMFNQNSNPTVTNCTFSGNSAIAGGAMANYSNSIPTVTNSTFSGNAGTNGGGMYNSNSSNPLVRNCIFWNVSGGEIFDVSSAPAVAYSDVQGGYVGTGNINADPLLGPLADNGGPTKTHALSADSPAIDAGMTFDASIVSTDQRGVARPQGVSFDIGAYEYWEKKILTVTTIGNGSVTRDPSGDVVGTTGKCWSYADGATVTLTAVDGDRGFFAAWGGDASGITKTASVTMSCDHGVEASFDVAWIVTVSAGAGGDITPSAPGAGSAGFSAPDGRRAGMSTVKVRDGWNQTFTVTPNAGYSIGAVLVDNTIAILGAGSKYTFANVSRDHAIEATFTANPTPTPTAAPTDAPGPTATPTATPTPAATPTPVPTPDPRVPLPTASLKITLYAGGTLVAGPIDITDPSTLSGLLSSPTLLAQFLSERYNAELVRFFSLVADLDDGALDFTILFEVTVGNLPAGYRAQVFVLTRTFDSKGNPTGYSLVPRNEGANVFRKGSGATGWTETWRVTVRDGGVTDGDARQNGSVAPQIAAIVAVFPMATPTATMTPTQGSTGSGGGCSIPASGGAALAAILLLAPVVLMRRR